MDKNEQKRMGMIGDQLLRDIEEDDRMVTVWVISMIYPELTIKEVFEILNDRFLLESLYLEIESMPNGSINEPHPHYT